MYNIKDNVLSTAHSGVTQLVKIAVKNTNRWDQQEHILLINSLIAHGGFVFMFIHFPFKKKISIEFVLSDPDCCPQSLQKNTFKST